MELSQRDLLKALIVTAVPVAQTLAQLTVMATLAIAGIIIMGKDR